MYGPVITISSDDIATISEGMAEILWPLICGPLAMGLCFGGVWLINDDLARFLAYSSLGILPLLIIPVAIFIVLSLLMSFSIYGVLIETLSIRCGYSVLLSYLVSPWVFETGIFGSSSSALYITYAISFSFFLGIFNEIISSYKALTIWRGISGISYGLITIYTTIAVTLKLLVSIRWISYDYMIPFTPDLLF